MQTLHIALILDDMYPDSSGVSRSVQTQVVELERAGHNVTLIAPQTSREPPENTRTIAAPCYRPPGVPPHTTILSSDQHVAQHISRQQRLDVIHSHTDVGAIILAARIARLQDIPHVHTFHTNVAGAHIRPALTLLSSLGYRLRAHQLASVRGHSPRNDPQAPGDILSGESTIGRFDWRTQAMMAACVDAFTTPSGFMQRYIRAAAPDRELTGRVIPTGYNRSLESIVAGTPRRRREGGIRFISISRIAREKRLDVVIDAFRQARIPESQLIIVGDGAELPALRARAEDMPQVVFTGHIGDQSALVQHLRDSDVFVLASHGFDNQPIAVVESLVAGVPVLYCDERLDIGLHPTNSLLVGPSQAALADGMVALADDGRRRELAEGTTSVFTELSPEATARAYIELYEAAIAGRSREEGA